MTAFLSLIDASFIHTFNKLNVDKRPSTPKKKKVNKRSNLNQRRVHLALAGASSVSSHVWIWNVAGRFRVFREWLLYSISCRPTEVSFALHLKHLVYDLRYWYVNFSSNPELFHKIFLSLSLNNLIFIPNEFCPSVKSVVIMSQFGPLVAEIEVAFDYLKRGFIFTSSNHMAGYKFCLVITLFQLLHLKGSQNFEWS